MIPAPHRRWIREALAALDVRNLVLGFHDLSAPSAEDDDTGRGSLYGEAGLRFLRFVRDLGFDGIQLGPQGETPDGSASPYDGTVFSRNPLSISLSRLAERDGPWGGILARDSLSAAVAGRPPDGEARVPYAYVHRTHGALLREAFAAFASRGDSALPEALSRFERQHAAWLERDVRDEALRANRAAETGLRVFVQFVAHEQHRRLRSESRGLGLRLYGDLQIGLSARDARGYPSILLDDYVMGAPPSRTNPEGQAWGNPVLDPLLYGDLRHPGPAMRFVQARVAKMLEEYDALRIDHPHGLVCPWVYRAGEADPGRAVQAGARLFSSPELPDHPGLARFAIARRDQLNPDPRTPRHADDWVVRLDPEQVDRYALLFDAIVDCAKRAGCAPSDLVCEVLSTLPHPLRRVLERHGLGRFRVTQKADVRRPDDVYRSENAAPGDWIMVGNHDTPPLWRRIEEWAASGELPERAAHLAERLVPEPGRRGAFAGQLLRDPGLFAHAQFADLFASPARHVMIFFTDLFGVTEIYNRPGVVSPDNWCLRVPRDYAERYRARLRSRRALNLPRALALALHARGPAGSGAGDALLRRLEGEARGLEGRLAPQAGS